MGRERKYYPLVMKPGIQRDGSENQSLSAINGTWMRFQRGLATTMGGITAADSSYFFNRATPPGVPPSLAGNYLTSMKAFSWNGESYLFVSYIYYLPTDPGGDDDTECGFYIFKYELNGGKNNSFKITPYINYKFIPNVQNQALVNAYFLFEGPFTFNENPDINPDARKLSGDYFYAQVVHDSSNIAANDRSQLFLLEFTKTIDPNTGLFTVKDLNASENVFGGNTAFSGFNFNGGIRVQEGLYVAFGDGYFIHSTWPDFRQYIITSEANLEDDIQTLTDAVVTPLAGTNQKIVQGYFTRGGGNAPTLLFWSLSSVIRALNVSSDTSKLSFKTDIISDNCSILSRDCVVQMDGIFYWIGVDRFYVYNGTVQELPNNFNLNDFFNNIDMTQRQNVVGAINPRYGEIWWFYPDIRYQPYSSDGANVNSSVTFDGNTAAIIYNIREECWYTVPDINRDCASFSSTDGYFFCGGCDNFYQNGIDPTQYDFENNYAQIYIHDTPMMKKKTFDFNPATGECRQMQWEKIQAGIQTPYVSWKYMSPSQEVVGANRQINLVSVEPDVQFPQDNTGTLIRKNDWSNFFNPEDKSITVNVLSKKYLLGSGQISSEERMISPNANQLTYSNSSGSYISLALRTTFPFQIATFLLQFEFDGEK